MLDSSPCRLLLSPGTRWAPRSQCIVARTVDCTVSVTVSATRSDIRATTASRISEREGTATSSFASVGSPSWIFTDGAAWVWWSPRGRASGGMVQSTYRI